MWVDDADFQALVKRVQKLEGMVAGRGISIDRTAGNFLISCTAVATEGITGTPQASGTPIELDHVQGEQDTDTWEAATDKKPVIFHALTDWGYDTSTHELYFRTRPVKMVAGAVGAEVTRVVCETAVEDVD